MTPATPPNVPVAFDLAITNPSGASCPVDQFQFFGMLPFPLTADQQFGFVSAGPGQTVHTPINVSAFDAGASGPIPFQYFVGNTANFNLHTFASATFVIAPPAPPMRTGCAPTPTAPVAPGGYYVNGNTVCTMAGRAHTFHGVDRPSLEWMSTGQNISLSDFQLMATWKSNVVRISLNQDFWLVGSAYFDPSYVDTIDNAVAWAEMAGLDVILDLHWSDRGMLGGCNPAFGCQQLMPDTNSATFWSEVALLPLRRARDVRAVQRTTRRRLEHVAQRRPDARGLDRRRHAHALRHRARDGRREHRRHRRTQLGLRPVGRARVPDRGPQHRLRAAPLHRHERLHAPAVRLGPRVRLPDGDRSRHRDRVRRAAGFRLHDRV